MKRIVALLCAAVIGMGVFTGCGSFPAGAGNSDKIKVVCTIFPQYDWVRQIIGEQKDRFDVKLLTDNGVDMHSYQPSAADIAAIASCDILIYVGGESDQWVENALKEAVNKEMAVINMMEVLKDSIKEEEIIEGMQGSGHAHNHEEHYHEEEHDHEEEIEYDEHVWLSVKNAEAVMESLTEALSEKDKDHAADLQRNAKNYIAELEQLDLQYQEAVNTAKRDTLLFGDRFPFRYLIDDYELNYYAAFAGCSSETNASFETVVFLSGKIDELGLNAILVIENSNEQVAKTIIENTKKKNAEILTLDSMQSVTEKDIAGGYTYLSSMQNNLEVLKKALNS